MSKETDLIMYEEERVSLSKAYNQLCSLSADFQDSPEIREKLDQAIQAVVERKKIVQKTMENLR